jgi:aminoglycoside phosphotransferase (APT) family kinase protein
VAEPDRQLDDTAFAWLREVLGAPVTWLRSLSFGISSELTLVDAGGERFVVRRYPGPHPLDERPEIVSDEATVLMTAHAILGDVVPRPVAADAAGGAAGRPTLVMTYLEGAPQIRGLEPALLVAPLTRLHRAHITTTLPAFRHWYDAARAHVPDWTTHAETWAGVVALAAGPEPMSPRAFIHRDFHPGNLLWRDGALRGIVDWAFACWGPLGAEVAHTRANLALVDGVAAAERFLAEYVRAEPSYAHDPWWDAAELLTWDEGFSGVMAFNAFGAGLELGDVRARADEFARSVVASARAAAGGGS